jgi:dTDP-4-amino-4,6-dideoxygalactose transaminase
MSIPFLDLERLYQGRPQLLDEAIQEVLQENIFVGGPQPALFEEAFAKYTGTTHAIACGNGTDALELMLEAAEIGAGDEVIVPAISWVATAAAVVRVGALPVFADVEESYFTLDPAVLPSLLTEKTKAVLTVHLYGQMANMPRLQEFTDRPGLLLFEDAAQAHGAELDGKKAGSWGMGAAFSFYPTKNLGALGDAGAVLTSNDQLAREVQQLGNHGQLKKHEHELLGRNSRMDSLQAAVLLAKLPFLNAWNSKRRELAQLYNEQLSALPEVVIPRQREGALHVYHLYVIRCSERGRLKEFLAGKGIETAIHYPQALSSLSIFQQFKGAGQCPVAEKISSQILSLPLYPGLSKEEVSFICESIKSFYLKKS